MSVRPSARHGMATESIYLLVSSNTEVRRQRNHFRCVLGIPVLPELVKRHIGVALDVGHHLEMTSV